MSEQTATRFQDLLDLLNLQDEDGASAAASAEKLLHLTNEKFNLLMVGATGSGKSSTINALFDTQVAEVGTGVDPETASIDCYALDNFCIWDTPGLGDGVENDIAIAKAIKAKLSETDPEGAQVVDMVLIVLDASTKDLGTVYTLLNEVVIPRLGSEAEQRILIGLNQSDMAQERIASDWTSNGFSTAVSPLLYMLSDIELTRLSKSLRVHCVWLPERILIRSTHVFGG